MLNKKFRSWDSKENRFWYFTLQEVLERKMAYMGSWDSKIMRGEKTQYTGLKDINNKEIYEDDIVIVDMKYFDIKGDKGKVIFKNGCFGVQFGCTDEYFKTISAWDMVEVIGNVYENKDSIKYQ